MILMLEDDAERISRFSAVVNAFHNVSPLKVWRDAHCMMREAPEHLWRAEVISLDHDLIPAPGDADPGDGYMVAQWLTSQPIIRPVIVHSSNAERSTWMAGALDLAGWRHYRVPPLGDDWIENDWRKLAVRLVKKARKRPPGGWLSEEQKAELLRRDAEMDADPSIAISWEEMKAHMDGLK